MMKKLLISFLTLLIAITNSYSQSFEISTSEGLMDDTTYMYQSNDSARLFTLTVMVKNISENAIFVKATRTNIDVIDGTTNNICFNDVCYPDFIDTVPHAINLAPGETTGAKSSLVTDYFSPVGTIGSSVIKYSFYDSLNMDNVKEFYIVYKSSPLSVGENLQDMINISNIYPNPATNKINIDYDFGTTVNTASLKIINLLGSVVKDVELDKSSIKLSMDISDLNAGVYFYSIVVNNDVFQTKKLVIR